MNTAGRHRRIRHGDCLLLVIQRHQSASCSPPSIGAGHGGGWNFTGLVAFGDSLSDMGNRWLDTALADTEVTFHETWVARLAGPEMLNFPNFKPSGTVAFYGGSNYAVGGAGTMATLAMTSERNSGHHLTEQLSGRYLNPVFNPGGVQRDALHVVVIGANDIMRASMGPEHLLSQWSALHLAGVAVARSTEGQIHALAEAGVRHVLWGNIFDVGKTPAVAQRARMLPALAPVYLAAVTKAVLAHNLEMEAAMTRLMQAHAGLKILKLDLFGCFEEMEADPGRFGFANVTQGADDAKHLFSADGLHPTPQGHKALAEHAFAFLKAQAWG